MDTCQSCGWFMCTYAIVVDDLYLFAIMCKCVPNMTSGSSASTRNRENKKKYFPKMVTSVGNHGQLLILTICVLSVLNNNQWYFKNLICFKSNAFTKYKSKWMIFDMHVSQVSDAYVNALYNMYNERTFQKHSCKAKHVAKFLVCHLNKYATQRERIDQKRPGNTISVSYK